MWVHLPESCHSAAAAEPLTSRSDSRLKALSRSVTWRGKLQLSLSWYRACKEARWMMRLCGLILPPLTADRGAESWMASLAGGPAKTSAVQDLEQGLPASDPASGTTSEESSTRSDRHGVSSKTRVPFCRLTESVWTTDQIGLFSGLSEPYSETWPSSGTMRSGACFERRTLGLLIGEQGGGAWLTPTVNGNHNRAGLTKSSGDGTATAATAFPDYPTPTAISYGTNQGGSAGRTGPVRPSLQTWCQTFPRDEPTGPAGDGSSNAGPGSDLQWLKELVGTDGVKHLNPFFAAWLMGLPLHWTLTEPIESGQQATRLYRSRLQQRLGCLLGEQEGR